MTAPAAATHPPPLPEGEVARPLRTVAMLAMLPFIAVALLALFLALDLDTRRLPMIGLALLTAVIALIPVCIDAGRAPVKRHLLFDVLCLMYLALFTIPVFTHYAWVVGPTDPPGVSFASLLPHQVVRGQMTALLGLIALFIGYAATTATFPSPNVERRRAADWPVSSMLIVTFGMLAVGWTVAFVTATGFMPVALGSGLRNTLGSSVNYANVLLVIALIRHRFYPALIILAVTVPMAAFYGLGTGSKQATLLALAAAVVTMMMLGGRLRFRWIILGVIAVILIYPVSEYWRAEVLPYGGGVRYLLGNPVQAVGQLFAFVTSVSAESYVEAGFFSTLARLDGLGILSVIVRDTPGLSPFQNGRTLILFFYAFVPRIIWPDKPMIPIGQWITDTYGAGAHISSFTAPTWLGEFYLNFGDAGVFFGLLVYGILLGLFQSIALGPGATTASILAGVVVMLQVVARLEASIASSLAATVFALVPIAVVHGLVKYFLPGARRAPGVQPDHSATRANAP